MKVHLKFKSLQYALMTTELLYDLHPVILKDMLDMISNRITSIVLTLLKLIILCPKMVTTINTTTKFYIQPL